MSQLSRRAERHLACAAWIVLACTAAPVTGAHARQVEPPVGEAQKTAASDLLKSLADASTAGTLTPARFASALLAAGPEETESCLAFLGEPFQARMEGEVTTALDRQRIRAALDGVPGLIVEIATLPQLGPKDRAHAYAVAMEVLAASSIQTSVPLLGSLLEAAPARRLSGSVSSGLQKTVARLAEDPQLSSPQLAGWIRAGGSTFSAAVVDGAVRAGALMKLVGCLHSTTGAEGVILNRVAGMIQRGAPVVPEATCAAVLPYLGSQGAFERREASAVLGMVGDRRHVAALIEALDDSEHMVRTSALKALKALTGMTISGDSGRWKLWYSEQEAWWSAKGSSLIASISSADRGELVSVLKEVCTRRLYRREIAAQLVQLLDRQRPHEVRVAIASLATLRDPSTLEPILQLREHPNALVRSSVEDAVVAFRHAGIKIARIQPLPAD
ncbi:hypothetical protein Poly30_26360 [Planctomycetes bacterium Poly30]|uniref:HEAT repeat protein n=1 Tax=Saltatorellus ferox TaxID=2528018 RepID=A0A518ESP2_9BACT|nr:hypothetical protein Poly30_26360 [Planctomycetes bacterium Poly30]